MDDLLVLRWLVYFPVCLCVCICVCLHGCLFGGRLVYLLVGLVLYMVSDVDVDVMG